MARVIIVGQAVVVTSELSLEDIKMVKKYRPDALILKGGENGDEPIFALSVGEGSIGKYGISFCDETREEPKKATLTMATSYAGDDIKEIVVDEFGASLNHLNTLEERIPAVIEEIKAERDAMMDSIIIVQ